MHINTHCGYFGATSTREQCHCHKCNQKTPRSLVLSPDHMVSQGANHVPWSTELIWILEGLLSQIPAFPPFTDDLGNPAEAAADEDAHAQMGTTGKRGRGKRGSPAIFQGPWLYCPNTLPERPAQTAGTDNRPSLLKMYEGIESLGKLCMICSWVGLVSSLFCLSYWLGALHWLIILDFIYWLGNDRAGFVIHFSCESFSVKWGPNINMAWLNDFDLIEA